VAVQAVKKTQPHAPALREQVLARLADGAFHSGESLAGALDVSRTAIWKCVRALVNLGIDINAVPKRGYRLPQRVELLEAQAVGKSLGAPARARVRHLQIELVTDSTNSRLVAVQDLPIGRSDVCIAELQTAGRGRRGRSWTAPFGSGICVSLSWQFPEVPRQLSALSLAIGVAVLRAFSRLGLGGVSLKWPNDLLVGSGKLGGILIELRAESAGPAYVVIGLGLNFHLGARVRTAFASAGLEAADLSDAKWKDSKLEAPGRNRCTAAIVESMIEALVEFEHHGLQPFAEEWRAADALAGVPARVQFGDQVYQGIARGIDEDGALLLEVPGQLLRFTSGEVTVRAAA
jgi:BirA family transcriptional regulator, biotin operon repressor / biotin---[acetyl-CoA-carboxylase] ligase